MSRLIMAAQPSAVKRRVYFHIVRNDGFTPATSEAGGQPQVSVDGGAWSNTGIGVLVAIGNGRYYAELTTGILVLGAYLEFRYQNGSSAECPAEPVVVIGYDPDLSNEAMINFFNGKKEVIKIGSQWKLRVYTAADSLVLYKEFNIDHPVAPSYVVPV